MNCQSCKLQKDKVTPVPSKALPGLNIIVCDACKRRGHEPRAILVLAARQGYSIREWIVKRKYHGKPLSAEEITV